WMALVCLLLLQYTSASLQSYTINSLNFGSTFRAPQFASQSDTIHRMKIPTNFGGLRPERIRRNCFFSPVQCQMPGSSSLQMRLRRQL
ncbi:hypothetical protein PFISCL1PPCAC_24298, partial [Pristionchus fissidentatus]